MSTPDHSAHWHEHSNDEPHEHGAAVPPWKQDSVRVLEFTAGAEPEDFIYLPPCAPHHPPAGARLRMDDK